jgi:hypothetical protein
MLKRTAFNKPLRPINKGMRKHQMENVFTSRHCPKCGGNMYLDNDYYIDGLYIDWYKQMCCLQCGFTIDIKAPRATASTVTGKAMPAIKELVSV